MPSNEQIITKYLERLKSRIQEEMVNKDLNASGETSNSLQVDKNKLYADRHIEALETGRPPGKFPPPDTLRSWVMNKLNISEEKKINSIAFLVGEQIATFGTEIYNDRTKGLEIDKLIEEVFKDMYDELAENSVKEILTFIPV